MAFETKKHEAENRERERERETMRYPDF